MGLLDTFTRIRERNRHYAGIEPFTSPLRRPHEVGAIAAVYRHVFGDHPWYEGYKCPVCHTSYPLDYGGRTCDCEGEVLLVQFWPVGQVITDFYAEMGHPGAECFIARADEGIVGFAWGYPVQASEELSKKLEWTEMSDHLSGDYFYVDEVALLSAYRGKGLGKGLYARLTHGKDRILYRTKKDSPMHHIGLHCGGKTAAEISNSRVIVLA